MSSTYPREKLRRVKERYSVAFSSKEREVSFELKVWHKSPDYMCLVVKEDSATPLHRLQVGERVRMYYYAADLERPSELLETEVVGVKENRLKRMRGQYFVDLQILKSYH